MLEERAVTNSKHTKEKNLGKATVLAFALLPLAGFATDIYLPSLPGMATILGVGETKVQLTLSLFLISYGISQLFIGSLLDSFGRYKISMVSLLIFALSCLVVANTSNIYVIYVMRIIHGMVVGAIVVAKRAFFVDMYQGDKLKHYLSLFSIIWSTGPIIAPFIGGYLQSQFGWESNFYFLALLALILFILEAIYSSESLKHRTPFQLQNIVKVYYHLLSTSAFTLGIIILGLAYSMVMIFNMTGPFIIEHHMGLSPVTTGYSALFLGFAWTVGGLISKATINRPLTKKMLINLGLQLLFVIAMLFSLGLLESLYALLFFAFIIHVCAGYSFNTYFTLCLGMFPKNAGVASGLAGGVTYVIVSVLSYGIILLLPAENALNLGLSYLIIVVITFVGSVFMFIKNRLTTINRHHQSNAYRQRN